MIDRIQIRIQQIYNIIAWKNHINILQFKSVQNFDSIGIGELKYSEQFVEKGEVDERIRVRDIRFMAEKMKLRMPPLPISHWEEIKIFNDFMKENNTLSNSKCVDLAELYKEKCNGI